MLSRSLAHIDAKFFISLGLSLCLLVPPVTSGSPGDSSFSVGDSLQWGDLCGTIVARRGDELTVHFPLSGRNRIQLRQWVETQEREIAAGRPALYSDREDLKRRVHRRRIDLQNGYTEYRLSLADRSWRVAFVVRPLSEIASPSVYSDFPWEIDSTESFTGKGLQLDSQLSEFSSIASLSEKAQQAWSQLREKEWRLVKLPRRPDDFVPFFVSLDDKTIVWLVHQASPTEDFKLLEAAELTAALLLAAHLTDSTYAPGHAEMNKRFLDWAQEQLRTASATKALSELTTRLRLNEGDAESSLALEMEGCRQLHLLLSLSQIELAVAEVQAVAPNWNPGEDSFFDGVRSYAKQAGPEMRSFFQHLPTRESPLHSD